MKLFRQLQGTKAFSRGELRVLGDLIEAGVQQLEDSKTDEEVWNDLDREEAAEQERVQRAAAKAGPPNGRRQASRKRY